MNTQLAAANAVVAAHNFNPSIVNQVWLVDHEVVSRDDFRPGCVFSDMLANIRTKSFECLVTPDRLQFTPTVNRERQQQLVVDVLGHIVELLPHTPFFAAGINLTWHVDPEPDIVTFSRLLFFNDDSQIFSAFDTGDAQFGSYMSKDALGGRLKLDIKPMAITIGDTTVQKLQLAFNFHLDVDRGKPVEPIKSFLSRWEEAFANSCEILAQLDGSTQ